MKSSDHDLRLKLFCPTKYWFRFIDTRIGVILTQEPIIITRLQGDVNPIKWRPFFIFTMRFESIKGNYSYSRFSLKSIKISPRPVPIIMGSLHNDFYCQFVGGSYSKSDKMKSARQTDDEKDLFRMRYFGKLWDWPQESLTTRKGLPGLTQMDQDIRSFISSQSWCVFRCCPVRNRDKPRFWEPECELYLHHMGWANVLV